MNILLLTSEFDPAQGEIGTYAREMAVAATSLGARVTVVAPDYAQDTSVRDRAMPFEVRRFRGGLHSARDLPAKIRLTRSTVGEGQFDVVHAADWPFFIPAALSRQRTQRTHADDRPRHGDKRSSDAAQAPGDSLHRRVRTAHRGRRQQPIYEKAVPQSVRDR